MQLSGVVAMATAPPDTAPATTAATATTPGLLALTVRTIPELPFRGCDRHGTGGVGKSEPNDRPAPDAPAVARVTGGSGRVFGYEPVES